MSHTHLLAGVSRMARWPGAALPNACSTGRRPTAPGYPWTMRTPKRRRQLPRKPALDVPADRLERCAMAASYVGSPEHKSMPSFAGPPKLRSDASRCPTDLKDAAEITDWLASAIRAGLVSNDPGDEGFPKYVWTFRRETWFEGRLVNEVQGTYKGYPLADDEVSSGLQCREVELRQAEEAS
jgi:hypothetical protein